MSHILLLFDWSSQPLFYAIRLNWPAPIHIYAYTIYIRIYGCARKFHVFFKCVADCYYNFCSVFVLALNCFVWFCACIDRWLICFTAYEMSGLKPTIWIIIDLLITCYKIKFYVIWNDAHAAGCWRLQGCLDPIANIICSN